MGTLGDAVKIRLKAPPVDGRANKALIAFLAKALNVGRSQVTLIGGQTSRMKRLRVDGLSLETATQRLLSASSDPPG